MEVLGTHREVCLFVSLCCFHSVSTSLESRELQQDVGRNLSHGQAAYSPHCVNCLLIACTSHINAYTKTTPMLSSDLALWVSAIAFCLPKGSFRCVG